MVGSSAGGAGPSYERPAAPVTLLGLVEVHLRCGEYGHLSVPLGLERECE